MKNFLKLKTYLLWLLIIVGILSVIGYNFILQKETKISEKLIVEEEGKFKLGEVNVDVKNGKIYFEGKVQKTNGWVQFLIYLHGYKWLKEESAIISEAKLSDLQKAIALLDWKLWDNLWYRKKETKEEKELLLFIRWDERNIPAQEFVLSTDKLEIGDFIFLGSPYFDQMALEASPHVDCRLCPIFPLEQKTLRKLFIRKSGQSGYELNSKKIPAKGTEVSIIIGIKK